MLLDPAKPGDIKSLQYTAPNISLEWFPSDGFVEMYRVVFQNGTYESTGNTAVSLTNLIDGTTYEVTITAVSHNRESEERIGTFTTSVAGKFQLIQHYLNDSGILIRFLELYIRGSI